MEIKCAEGAGVVEWLAEVGRPIPGRGKCRRQRATRNTGMVTARAWTAREHRVSRMRNALQLPDENDGEDDNADREPKE